MFESIRSATRTNVAGVLLLTASFAPQAAPQLQSGVPATPTAQSALAKMQAFEVKAEYYAKKAAYYRNRARANLDGKHEITWLTLANRCDQEAEHYRRLAVREARSLPPR
ncbi:MAG: hypothetical protein M0038_20595 [Pseudomonadota bacterium]|nr:hypothetical protein [Pseudomonadota bacterium]